MKTGPGVSIVICCHNSATRLPQTLQYAAAQQVPAGVSWEVILVDNASTDGTADAALRCWPATCPIPLRVVHESRPGLSFAREAALRAAKYEIISFVDDDNWICQDWVSLVSEIMGTYPRVGACGGRNDFHVAGEPPPWFHEFKRWYAVGEQAPKAGDITWSKGFLWGAGLSVRKAAWLGLIEKGFQSLLTGRKGAALSSGEDTELCYALRLCGWTLWYDPRLQLIHDLPPQRLTWDYVRRLRRSLGEASVGLDAYNQGAQIPTGVLKKLSRLNWQFRAAAAFGEVLRAMRGWRALFGRVAEGDAAAITLDYRLGQLQAVLRMRGLYTQSMRELRHAQWRTTSRA